MICVSNQTQSNDIKEPKEKGKRGKGRVVDPGDQERWKVKFSANLSTLGKWVQETRKEEKQDEAKHRHICLPGREEVKNV